MAYKIKFQCTNNNELSINNKDVFTSLKNNEILKDKIYYGFKLTNFILVIRTINKFNTKSLELFFNRIITKEEFKEVIDFFKKYGFESKANQNVEFIDTYTNNRIYNFRYNTFEEKDIKNKKYKKRPSQYSVWKFR